MRQNLRIGIRFVWMGIRGARVQVSSLLHFESRDRRCQKGLRTCSIQVCFSRAKIPVLIFGFARWTWTNTLKFLLRNLDSITSFHSERQECIICCSARSHLWLSNPLWIHFLSSPSWVCQIWSWNFRPSWSFHTRADVNTGKHACKNTHPCPFDFSRFRKKKRVKRRQKFKVHGVVLKALGLDGRQLCCNT